MAWEYKPAKSEWQDEQIEVVSSQALLISQVLTSIQVLLSYIALFSLTLFVGVHVFVCKMFSLEKKKKKNAKLLFLRCPFLSS